MAYRVNLYVDAGGRRYTASRTDQRGAAGTEGRTVGGRPVVWAGEWYGSQLGYGACRAAIRAAWERACREPALALTGLAADCPAGVVADRLRDLGRDDLADGYLALDAAPPVTAGYAALAIC